MTRMTTIPNHIELNLKIHQETNHVIQEERNLKDEVPIKSIHIEKNQNEAILEKVYQTRVDQSELQILMKEAQEIISNQPTEAIDIKLLMKLIIEEVVLMNHQNLIILDLRKELKALNASLVANLTLIQTTLL